MMYFKQTVLGKIKSAKNKKEIEDVVNESIQRLKVKNVHGYIIQRFIKGMDLVLDHARAELVSAKVRQNLEDAIGVFRKLHKPQ